MCCVSVNKARFLRRAAKQKRLSGQTVQAFFIGPVPVGTRPVCVTSDRSELVDHLHAEEIGVERIKTAGLHAALIICVKVTFADTVQPRGRNVQLEVFGNLKGRTQGEPQTVSIRNDGRAVPCLIHGRGFVTDTGTHRPPVVEAHVGAQ